MRVLLVIPTLDESGAEKQFTMLATGLPRPEFDVHVVALTRGGPYEAELKAAGIPVTILGKRFKFDPIALLRLRSAIAKLMPDVIHGWLFAGNSYVRLLAGGSPKPAVIVSERCVDVWKAGWQTWLDRRQIARTAALVGNSNAVAEFYRGLGYPADRVTVIPNAIEARPDAIPARLSQRDRVRAELQVPPDAHVIMYIGRLARQKRVADLVWAAELLNAMQVPIRFFVIGDGPERERLERYANSLDVGASTRFLGHRHDARSLLAAADVFWLASEFEGMSNSLMEAMAEGLPCVVSDIPANRELITDGETGRLAPVGDAAAFAHLTDMLLSDSAAAGRLGAAASLRMLAGHGVEGMCSAYSELYRAVHGRQNPVARTETG
jgi:glycosyltransferase involved in cell wall biosynthesis